jgi:hypothetical protein
MSLNSKQWEFSQSMAALIQHAKALGYEVVMGETYRTPAQAQADAASGAGIAHSLHCDSLAVDLNLFLDGKYITDSTGHADLGAWWKALGSDYRWGGDFSTRKDYNHYSLSVGDGRA